MADDVDPKTLAKMRQLPQSMDAIGKQMLLNLALSGENEIWLHDDNGSLVDAGDALRQRADSINMNFDSLMVKLGFPEGTGKFVV